MSVAVASLVVAGCSLLPVPSVPAISPVLSQGSNAQGLSFTLAPWPLDGGVAFLCLREPGDEFTAAHPEPAPAAQCAQLRVDNGNDRMTARFTMNDVPPTLVPDFVRSQGPWFLAAAGTPGNASATVVTAIASSPMASDPGPS